MRRKFSPLTLEQLERREMFAGDVRPTLAIPAADEFVGPLPLEPRKAAPTAEVSPLPTSSPGMSADDYFARFGNGNITAEVRDGRLIIRGDARDNVFTLYRYQDYQSGEQAVALSVGWWSMVNGEFWRGTSNLRERYSHFYGVTAIDIDLGDGNDIIRIHAIEVPSLTIRTGEGDDQITLLGPTPMSMVITDVYNPYPTLSGPSVDWNAPPEPLLIDGDLFIDTGEGNDQFTPFASVNGNATVLMGTGDDSYIEAPHPIQELYELPVVIDDIHWQLAPRRVIGKMTATGSIAIDLGPDQATEDIPANWRTDINLVGKLQNVGQILDFYRGLIERGEDTPGIAQIITAPYQAAARIDAEGRLEIEFSFTAGYARVIERLQARGVILEA